MPEHTSSPPVYRGEADFWGELLKVDDGNLHLWYGISLGSGSALDVLLLDTESSAFCIEAKALPLEQISHLELQTLTRKDGAVCPSPFGQAVAATRSLGAVLDRTWETRPDLIPVAAFPLIGRSDWVERFKDDFVCEFGERCLLKDDLVDLSSLRERLRLITAHPVEDRPRSLKQSVLQESDIESMDLALRGRVIDLKSAGDSDSDHETDVLALLDEVIRLVNGPGAAYNSPGARSLALWRAALDSPSERLRVSVVGEFKSGKSSLINAILGREVCFVDEFEATTMSATYTDGAEDGVTILDEQNQVDHWSVEAFLERCAKKELSGVRNITVTLPTGYPFDLVDSPGLGSNTEGHTDEAEMEVRRTDLLLWAVDSNDAGSARESAFIQRAREIGLPIIVLLTKSDVLTDDEIEGLVEYVSAEANVPILDILPVSAHHHLEGRTESVKRLIERLYSAIDRKAEFQRESYIAKTREAIDGARATLRFLIEINGPHARFLAMERGYLETSSLGISLAAKSEWLRVLREECSGVASSIASKSIDDPEVVELMLRKALPGAINRATAEFLQSLRRLVRDEWRGALEEKSREFETRLSELLTSRPDAKADLEFLRNQSEAFLLRAELIDAEMEPATFNNRLFLIGLGAAASVLTVSILPIAVAGVVAAVAMREKRANSGTGPKVDPMIANQIEDALLSSFEDVAGTFERAIDRIVAEVAERSLIKLLKRRGGPDLQTIVIIERKASDLMDELATARKC